MQPAPSRDNLQPLRRSPQSPLPRLPADVRQRGSLTVATNPNTPPTTYFGPDNRTLEGREIDIMTAVAGKLGLKVTWQDSGGFDNLIPGLQNARYDAAVSNLTATSERIARPSPRTEAGDASRPGYRPTPQPDVGGTIAIGV